MADDAKIGNRARIRPCIRSGKGEAGDFLPFRQTREIVIFLLFRAVMQQQLRRSQRIRHHHRYRRCAAARADLHHHLGMRQRRKAMAPILPGDNHTEKAVVLDELPDMGRQIVQLTRNVPFVQHCAQLFHRAGEKGFFFRAQFRLGVGQQLVPVRLAAEQVSVPPYGPRVQRLLFGLRNLRQDFAENF